jgi:hypothetical protein
MAIEEQAEIRILEKVRARFLAAAESCSKTAKAIVAATSQLIAERRGGAERDRGPDPQG